MQIRSTLKSSLLHYDYVIESAERFKLRHLRLNSVARQSSSNTVQKHKANLKVLFMLLFSVAVFNRFYPYTQGTKMPTNNVPLQIDQLDPHVN